jgi:uncharacterized phage protein (TIGR01671 family)
MREIKFRAWRKPIKANGEVYDGEMYYSERGDEKRFVSFGFYHDSGWGFDDFIFMLNTGLKDKHGKEIYEGDIIRCSPHAKMVRIVKYIMGEWKLTHRLDEPYPIGVVYTSHTDSEIIGNIHSNPELIK